MKNLLDRAFPGALAACLAGALAGAPIARAQNVPGDQVLPFALSTSTAGGQAFTVRQHALQSETGVMVSTRMVLSGPQEQAPLIDLSYRVMAADERTAHVGGLLVGLGLAAGLPGQELTQRLASAGLALVIVDDVTAPLSPAATVQPLADLIGAALAPGGRPEVGALFRDGAQALDLPNLGSGNVMGIKFWVPPPLNLRTTTDPTLCADKAPLGVLMCKGWLEKGDAVLVWDWYIFPPESPAGYVPQMAVDGYRIYRGSTVVGAPFVLAGTSPSPLAMGRAVPWVVGECYRVTAYAGVLESAPSNTICLGREGETTETIVLRATGHVTDARTREDHAKWACWPIACGLPTMGTGPDVAPAGALLAGYAWAYDNGTCPCNCWQGVDQYYSSGVTFNLASIPDLNTRFLGATLSYRSEPAGCADVVGLTSLVAGHLGSIGIYHDAASDPVAIGATLVSLKASDEVKDILSGVSGPYFAFRSAQQGSTDSIEGVSGGCVSTLTDLKLSVRVLK